MLNWLSEGIPLGDWLEMLVEWLKQFTFFFDGIDWIISTISSSLESVLFLFPVWLLIGLLALSVWWKARSWGLPLFIVLGLGLIWNLGYWDNMVYTLSLVLTAALISVTVGIPAGIVAARKGWIRELLTPVLDLMQTMPAFVYLIPAVFFFGIGTVPGVVASVIFSMPPVIRLTILGIRQVPAEIVEAADAFGSTNCQKLFKVQLPLAKQTIMAGVNQTIMLALSMVVIASMIGARGLGRDVYQAVTQNQMGKGFEAGLCIVVLAILLDRITQLMGHKQQTKKG
ncbi:glycine/betaine ABC transporter permease [Caldalkalibacillus thermarum]|uniref:ABC transporter permease n=1 Tax=Caldalkalibacillus thermarum TaxID=296745 RepID=UPI0016646F32|nr:proline/glycine betaine ABC transporter permease [Caldalkalibacillus thermarum]GGK11300.1 glycine/betaine ABC transporter permease [Caldalkalibacillus thermarum]